MNIKISSFFKGYERAYKESYIYYLLKNKLRYYLISTNLPNLYLINIYYMRYYFN